MTLRSRIPCWGWLVLLLALALGCSAPAPPSFDSAEVDPEARYLVGAHYYSWFPEAFEKGHLRGELRPPQQPELGHYSSWSKEVVERHIAWAAEYGIDFFTLDFWPDRPADDQRLELFLSANNLSDIRFCIFYETIALGYSDATGALRFDDKVSQRFLADMDRIAERYLSHPQYLRLQGRPVLILYVTRTFTGTYASTLAEARRRLQARGHDVFLIGDEVYWSTQLVEAEPAPTPPPLTSVPQEPRIRLFDAITAYNFYSGEQPEHLGYGARSRFLADVIALHEQFRRATQGEVPVVPSVIPGYNDRAHRPKKNHPAVPRQWDAGDPEGSLLIEMLESYALPFIDDRAPLLFVTSWNEWNEDTAIEPLALAPPSAQDRSGRGDWTQGYSYAGFGTTYLEALRDRTVAISGKVQGRQQQPRAGLAVSAWRGGRLVASDRTDSQGRFHLSRRNLTPGLYQVGLRQDQTQAVRVEARRTTTGLLFGEDQEHGSKTLPAPNLQPLRRDLALELESYLQAFPLADTTIVRSGEHRFYLDPADRDAVKMALRAGEPWKPHLAELLRRLLKPGDLAIEVGAHLGEHTVLISERVGRTGRVYAFEPHRKLYRELVQNLRLNRCSNAVPVPFALGNREGTRRLGSVGADNDPTAGVGPSGDLAEQRTLDSLDFHQVALIAIDAAGSQDAILEGARATLARSRPILLLELLGWSDEASATKEQKQAIGHTRGLLFALGYRMQPIWRHDYLALPMSNGPDRLWSDLGRPETQRLLHSGFSHPEQAESSSFVWTDGPRSQMALPLSQAPAVPYTLGLRGRAYEPIAPLTVDVLMNGLAVGELTFEGVWQGIELPIPAKALQVGANTVEFRCRQTGQPSLLESPSPDTRRLGICLDVVWLAPQALPQP